MHSGDKILNQFLKVLRYMENNTQSASPNRARQISERIEGMIAERYLEPDFSIVEIAEKPAIIRKLYIRHFSSEYWEQYCGNN